MKYFLGLILILFISDCKSQTTEIKVMTWNIWHGGLHGDKAHNFEKDSSNTINVVKVLQQHNPDVLFMQETYCCGMDLAKEAGYKYSWRGSSNLSIHSRYPIIDTIRVYKPFHSHGVKINVSGKEIMCYNIWLHYLPNYIKDAETKSAAELIEGEEATRYSEIKSILTELAPVLENSDKVPVIMGGDFNSGSHIDWIESTKHLHKNKVVQWPVSKEMFKYGFKDSFREIHPDPLKTQAYTCGYIFENNRFDRIDYIYYKGNSLDLKDSKIISEDPPGGFFNSDHRAVVSTFIIN